MFSEILEKYLEIYPQDRRNLKLLIKQVEKQEALDDRRNFKGHIAGDAIILSPDLSKILYIHHLRSGRWQQPGGHLDKGEAGPWITAAREAFEETGVKLAKKIGPVKSDERIPLHITTGPVSASDAKKELSHWHHDFRYGYVAESEELGDIQDKGIADARWIDLDEAIQIKDSGHNVLTSIERMMKLLQ